MYTMKSYYDVRPVNRLWVQLGDVECAIRTKCVQCPAYTSYPASYLKSPSLQQDKVGQARLH